MSKTKRQLALVCSIALLGSMAVQAAPVSPMTQQEQLEQARRADEARSERLQQRAAAAAGTGGNRRRPGDCGIPAGCARRSVLLYPPDTAGRYGTRICVSLG